MKGIHPLAQACLLGALTVITWRAQSLGLSMTVVIGLFIVSLIVGGPRAAILRPMVGIAVGVSALWLALALLLPPPDANATVLFTLPSWHPGPDVVLGGPVTTGALMLAAEISLRCWALALTMAIAVQMQPGRRWLDLLALGLGRATALLALLVGCGEGLARSFTGRRMVRQAGLRSPATATVFDGIGQGRVLAETWMVSRYPTPVPLVRRVIGIGLGALAAVLLALATTSFVPLNIPHTKLPWMVACGGLWAAVFVVRLVFPGRRWLGGFGIPEVMVLATTAMLCCAWVFRAGTGDQIALESALTAGPAFPVVLCCSVVVAMVVITATHRVSMDGGSDVAS